jgi:hypothetical protein
VHQTIFFNTNNPGPEISLKSQTGIKQGNPKISLKSQTGIKQGNPKITLTDPDRN